jgi:hypothetical protein
MKIYAAILFLLLTSCVNLENICKKADRLNGEVVYSVPTGKYYRKVTLIIDGEKVVVRRVPMEQPLYNIPACKHNGKYYWVMP